MPIVTLSDSLLGRLREVGTPHTLGVPDERNPALLPQDDEGELSTAVCNHLAEEDRCRA